MASTGANGGGFSYPSAVPFDIGVGYKQLNDYSNKQDVRKEKKERKQRQKKERKEKTRKIEGKRRKKNLVTKKK